MTQPGSVSNFDTTRNGSQKGCYREASWNSDNSSFVSYFLQQYMEDVISKEGVWLVPPLIMWRSKKNILLWTMDISFYWSATSSTDGKRCFDKGKFTENTG